MLELPDHLYVFIGEDRSMNYRTRNLYRGYKYYVHGMVIFVTEKIMHKGMVQDAVIPYDSEEKFNENWEEI